MTDTVPETTDDAALAHPFVRALILRMRAQDTHGAWESRSDAVLLRAFILTRQQRRTLPIIADPDPLVLQRVEMFYQAVGLAIEKETGVMATPVVSLNSEGFGRMILTAGRLVVLSRHLRDVHRFGFETLAKLAEQGATLVAESVAMMARFPEVVQA
ncbi:MAG: hypothetical protein FD149_430 [Rhodospirillaceae bacterium]|nr:MAG: hypothetical protein FD149_430 [Rhodospirillaceae bacterium]